MAECNSLDGGGSCTMAIAGVSWKPCCSFGLGATRGRNALKCECFRVIA